MQHAHFFTEAHMPTNQPWTVHKLLRASSVALIAAAPNTFKTWGGLDLCRATVTGGTWMGRHVAQGAVMLVSLDSALADVASQFRRLTQSYAERGPEARAQVADLIFRYDVPPGGLDLQSTEKVDALIEAANSFVHKTRTWPGGRQTKESKSAELHEDGFHYTLVPGDVLHVTDAEGEEIEAVETRWALDAAHQGVNLILIDSLSTRSTAEQNAAEQMGITMANLRRIADETGALVLVLHHNRKLFPGQSSSSGGLDQVRGSGVITAVPETVILFDATSDRSVVSVSIAKQRGPKDKDWRIMLSTSGDPEADNEYTVVKYREFQEELNEYLSDDARDQWDPNGEHEPVWSVEHLYKEPRAWSSAEIVVLKDASPRVEKLVRFLVSAGGSSDLNACTAWCLTSPDFVTDAEGDRARVTAAKKWVKNTVSAARAEGWIAEAKEDAKGVYTLTAKAHAQYGSTGMNGAVDGFRDLDTETVKRSLDAVASPDDDASSD